MSYRNTLSSYGSVAKTFHWLISVLVICMLIFGYFLGDFPKDVQPLTYNLHKMTGITILFLMTLRLLWALVNPKPELPIGTLSWQRTAERIGHFTLYLFVILMPLSGWIGSVASGRPPHLGNVNFELPVPKDKALAGAAFDMHGTAAIILIVLLIGHVLAALYHHYIKKDNILIRMLPNGRRC